MSDLPALEALLGDAEVMEFGDGAQSKEQQECWLHQAVSKLNSAGMPESLAIERKNDGAVLGYLKLSSNPDRVAPGEVEIGYRLIRAAWGQGYAGEAVELAIQAAAKTGAFARVLAVVDPNNSRSVRVAEKAGMQIEREIWFEGYDYADMLYVRRLSG